MLIERYIMKQILEKIGKKKAIIILGPRQAGKTTLISQIIKESDKKIMVVNGEDTDAKKWLSSQSISTLKTFIGKT
jgi:uncharacterized protein